jgi:hypothetical protein
MCCDFNRMRGVCGCVYLYACVRVMVVCLVPVQLCYACNVCMLCCITEIVASIRRNCFCSRRRRVRNITSRYVSASTYPSSACYPTFVVGRPRRLEIFAHPHVATFSSIHTISLILLEDLHNLQLHLFPTNFRTTSR